MHTDTDTDRQVTISQYIHTLKLTLGETCYNYHVLRGSVSTVLTVTG